MSWFEFVFAVVTVFRSKLSSVVPKVSPTTCPRDADNKALQWWTTIAADVFFLVFLLKKIHFKNK